MITAPILPRELLADALGNPRLAMAFEQQSLALQDTQAQASATAEAADRLEAATFVTLSPNGALANERVLTVGGGLRMVDADGKVVLETGEDTPRIQGGFPVYLTVVGPTSLALPLSGSLATLAGSETLANKTLAKPILTELADHADDAAAATGGVPVGGVYHTAGALRVRLA